MMPTSALLGNIFFFFGLVLWKEPDKNAEVTSSQSNLEGFLKAKYTEHERQEVAWGLLDYVLSDKGSLPVMLEQDGLERSVEGGISLRHAGQH